MRKFWLVIPLVLVAVVWLYGCDESPVAPDSAVAATQQGEAAFAKKPPEPVPPTTGLVGVVMVINNTLDRTSPGNLQGEAFCPAGKVPIAGGVGSNGGSGNMIWQNTPVSSGSQKGWAGGMYLPNSWGGSIKIWAVCADGVWEDPALIVTP